MAMGCPAFKKKEAVPVLLTRIQELVTAMLPEPRGWGDLQVNLKISFIRIFKSRHSSTIVIRMSFKNILTVSMILLALIDIISSIPVVIGIRGRTRSIHAENATLTVMGIMFLFLFPGDRILKIIGVDISSFAIAGAFALFFISLEVILGIKIHKDEFPETASIIPIAFPHIAGAGTMTTLLALRAEYAAIEIIIGIVVNLLVVYLCLKNVGFPEKLPCPIGIGVVRKVFGFILLVNTIKIFRTNLGF